MRHSTLHFLLCICLCLAGTHLSGQCTTRISAFPYIENFETSPAWTSGGPTNTGGTVVNTWAWGAPSKPVINSAGSGLKCWIVGGLSGLSYGTGERSYIQSPCFDFTNLRHPYISFLVFWESEWKYDGAVLQYSLNSGTSWTNLGSVNDAVDCLDSNWYNHNPISGLGVETLNGTNYPALASTTDGWCGNIQPTSGSCQGGNGSRRWVLAKHCMSALAGQSSVIFRFAFGAGTTCNAFNGFAIDSVCIREAPANTADFTYTCVNTNTISFSGITTLCPNAFSWNFGDPSGGSNTSASLIPTHTFSAAGTYNVTFTDSGGCNAAGTVTKAITVISAAAVKTDISCAGASDGLAAVNASGAGAYSYAWSTTPVQNTDTIKNLSAGSYTVTVTAAGACQATASVTISQPTVMSHVVTTDSASCGAPNGSITIQESGGTPGYSYLWSPSGSGAGSTGLVAGQYSVTISDSRGCRDSLVANVATTLSLTVRIDSTNISCHGSNDGRAIAIASGNPPLRYSWSNQSTADTISNLAPDIYTVSVTDAGHCTGTARVSLAEPDSLYALSILTQDSCTTGVGSISVSVVGGTPPYHYLWSPGTSSASQLSALMAGAYTLIITDAHSCTINEAYVIGDTCIVDSLIFPTAFSPNNDHMNDTFGPVYRGTVTDYQLHIYNKWGQLVFESTDPAKGWDGNYKNSPQPIGVYQYFSTFTEHSAKVKEGTLTLFR